MFVVRSIILSVSVQIRNPISVDIDKFDEVTNLYYWFHRSIMHISHIKNGQNLTRYFVCHQMPKKISHAVYVLACEVRRCFVDPRVQDTC